MQADVEPVRGIIEALNRGDVDGMLAHMHPNFEWTPLEASPVARVYRGHEGGTALCRGLAYEQGLAVLRSR